MFCSFWTHQRTIAFGKKKMAATFEDLPESVLASICLFIEPETLFRVCSCVCRLWREASLSPVLWIGFLRRLGVDADRILSDDPSADLVALYRESGM
jgi:hypothetical protein